MNALPSSPLSLCLTHVWCVLALTAAGCAHSPEPAVSDRHPSLDAAARAAAREIKRMNRQLPEPPVEWAFNLFRDERGYFPGNFHTDRRTDQVTLHVERAALAAGHSHTRKPGGRALEVFLSPWDRGPNGVLAALERSGRPLPHYLVTPVGSIRVWEWSGEPERWIVRKLPR